MRRPLEKHSRGGQAVVMVRPALLTRIPPHSSLLELTYNF